MTKKTTTGIARIRTGVDNLDLILNGGLPKGAMTVLSAEEREAVALRFGADLTVPEMAKAAGERVTTVEGRLYRALRKLRAELD